MSFFFQSCLFYVLKIQQSQSLSICYNLVTADVDECAIGKHSCHNSATCRNTHGSYTCFCKSGYAGDGIFCTSKCIYFPIRVNSSVNNHILQLCGKLGALCPLFVFSFAYQLSVASLSEFKSFLSKLPWRQPQNILWRAYPLAYPLA